MEIIKGISASPGVVIARAVVLDPEEYRVARPTVPADQVESELAALRQCFDASTRELQELRSAAKEKFGADTAAIFDFHLGILHSPKGAAVQAEELVRQKHSSAAFAVHAVMQLYQRRFRKMTDPVLAARAKDLQDVERRLLRHLLGPSTEGLADLTGPAVIVARDLTPSQTAQFDPAIVRGVATDLGGPTSHTAIIAHSLRIPAVVGLKTASSEVAPGDLVVVDGTHGVLIIDPDRDALARARAAAESIAVFELGLRDLRELPAVTLDGVRVELLGNIEFPHEAAMVVDRGGQGVGLYRTEFLYVVAEGRMTEEQHFEAYCRAGEALGQLVLTVRTIDVGADKYAPFEGEEVERNPFLGLRSIRYCLQNLGLFKTQLRAVLRAASRYNIRIMFPLVTSLMELRQAKMLLGEAMEDLEEAGVPFNRNVPIGIMVETPGTVLQCRAYAREVDFVSIGTNDLVQYTVAVDRSNERVASLYSASHPAVLILIQTVIKTAARSRIGCSLCGEMASEPIYTLLLLGMGLRSFSMPAGDIPEIKKLIRSTTIKNAERVAKRAMNFDTDRQVSSYLREETRKIMPEVV